MDFVDRKNEHARLKKALESSDSRFIVTYGRRRLGKSTLLKRMLHDNDVYFEATKNEAVVQISMFATAVAATYDGFDLPMYPTWDAVLSAFNRVCGDNTTLVLDEFPYLVEKDNSLPSVIQKHVDSKQLRYNLIICGSSQRMMQRIILDSSEPLYGRADERINLQPIAPQHWQDPMNLDAIRVIEEYTVWGGVPRYWTLRERYTSLMDAIEDLVLNTNGVLSSEPESLFLDEVSDIAPYAAIMLAIGQGNERFSNIATALAKKTNELSRPLAALTDMHYLRKDIPFGESEEKTKKTLYVLDDPFLAFYYRFVYSRRSLLALGRTEVVKREIENELPRLIGRMWERLCLMSVSGNTMFGHTWNVARRWWGKIPVYAEGRKTPVGSEDIEIDLVAQSLDDPNVVLVGECKWTKADFADRLMRQLVTKTQKTPFAQGKKIIYVLFLKERPVAAFDGNVMYPEDVLINLP